MAFTQKHIPTIKEHGLRQVACIKLLPEGTLVIGGQEAKSSQGILQYWHIASWNMIAAVTFQTGLSMEVLDTIAVLEDGSLAIGLQDNLILYLKDAPVRFALEGTRRQLAHYRGEKPLAPLEIAWRLPS